MNEANYKLWRNKMKERYKANNPGSDDKGADMIVTLIEAKKRARQQGMFDAMITKSRIISCCKSIHENIFQFSSFYGVRTDDIIQQLMSSYSKKEIAISFAILLMPTFVREVFSSYFIADDVV